ncbi:hypothetical protein WG219_18475 [Ectopseudomonas mendocina]|uniref:Uncharacterized protein n=1 Tax=Ectopseudomonas mendocina TaxID=300 RepID=A0ABZ2RI33_ECTME
MNFYRSKVFWIGFVILAPLLLLTASYGIKVMTSVFKKDLGNGVVIYADGYVKTGKWVFDCKYRRLISRDSLQPPITELERAEELPIDRVYALNDGEQKLADEVVKAITALPRWYDNLRYLYSVLDEYSDLRTHVFDMIIKHAGQQWALRVRQNIGNDGVSRFKVTAEPYDPATYVDYAKALQAAAKSCPVPQ